MSALAYKPSSAAIDTRDPLDIGEGAATVENHAYVDSWKAG